MLRGGGVCVEGPATSTDSLPRVSPRIRALQDRLLDSLPADGAWECLSPAQREAIISLHRARLTRNFVTGDDAPERGKRQNQKNNVSNVKALTKGLNRYGRSRSYEDKLESETDDSGVRVASGEGRGTNSSSASNSQNSHEDDSSDPGVKRARGGRFAKSASADRLARSKEEECKVSSSHVLDASHHHKRKGMVTNGVGNVNKIISKQLNNRSGPHQSASNVTLDCRNFQGDRRRMRVDKDGSVFETRQQQQQNAKLRHHHAGKDSRLGEAKPQEAIISRKNILQKYQDSSPIPRSPVALKEGKESTSSEEYDSGVNFRFDGGAVDGECVFNQTLKSPGPRRPASGGRMGYDFDFESDRTPRSDSTIPSPCSPNRKEVGRGFHEGQPLKSRSKTSIGADDTMENTSGYTDKRESSERNKEALQWDGDNRNGGSHLPSTVLKRNDKTAMGSYESKMKSDFDYRNHLNQEGIMNKYSSNWNSIILSKELPIKTHNIPPAKAHPHNISNPMYRTSAAPHGRSAGNLVATAAAAATRAGSSGHQSNEVRTKFDDGFYDWGRGGGAKKFARSKSLDRKYLEEEEEDSSDDESDFEVRRRTERMRRYAKAASLEWEAQKQLPFDEISGCGIPPATAAEFLKLSTLPDYPLHESKTDAAGVSKPKAKSAWDISVKRPFSDDLEDEVNHNSGENCFRSRSTILNRWKSEESELASHPVSRAGAAVTAGNKLEGRRKGVPSKDLSRSRWRRRSCDFELDVSDNDLAAGGMQGWGGNPPTTTPRPFDIGLANKQWQRRSCDFELELGNTLEDEFQQRGNLYDEDCWDQSFEGEMRLLQRRQRLQSCPSRGGELRRRRGYPTQESPGGDEVKKKKVVERCYLQEEVTVEGRPCREEMVSKLTPIGTLDENVTHYQIRPEITGRKWARIEDLQNCPSHTQGFPSGLKPTTKGKSGRTPLGFRENGVLSFENPNYTLGNSLDDALNSNTNTGTTTASTTAQNNASNDSQLDGGLAALDSLYSELDHVCNLTRTSSARNRRHYAQLDIGSMGVDVTKGPVTNLDHADHQNNSLVENEGVMGRKKGGGFTPQPDFIEHASQRYNSQPQQPQQQLNNQQINNQETKSNQNEKDPDKAMVTPEGTESAEEGVQGDSSTSSAASKSPYKERSQESPLNEGHIPHMTPFDSQDLYALPVKCVPSEETQIEDPETEEKKDPNTEDTLPFGWEKHEDNDGPYYWHIKSGTITRTPPNSSTQVQPHAPLRAERRNKDDQINVTLSGTVTRSNTSSALSELSEARPRNKAIDNAHKRRSYPARSDLSCDSGGSRPIRFAVRSLGWVEIAEEDLTPERSSKAVNRCIVDLSVGGRRDVLDVVGRWGDGKDLFMDLDEGSLKLVDPENLTVLNTQPIHTIRVWGVGRDNGRERDFAYVARDRVTRKHMCHVFRCDTPARTIANTLRDICKKIMIERSLQQTISKPLDSGQMGGVSVGRVARPTNLPTEHRRLQRHSQIIPPQSFPTPMEEPKKVMRAHYVGAVEVTKPSGMDVLNAAIQTMVENNPAPWKSVAVAVAPSTITIANTDDGRQLAECRVRFLSFLGIGQNVKHCAFIMHTAQDQFIAHIFYCEPSSGALCKTIEAACKLRYQKCLDAHPGGSERGRGEATPRSLSSTLRSVFTTFAGKKARSTES